MAEHIVIGIPTTLSCFFGLQGEVSYRLTKESGYLHVN